MRKRAVILCIGTITVLSAITVYGYIGMIPVVGDTKCKGKLTASSYLTNTNQDVTVKVSDISCVHRIIGRASEHKRWAYYYFSDATCLIRVNGTVHRADSVTVNFDKAGDYIVEAAINFRWKVDRGKINAGFKPYYYQTIIVSKVIRVSDLEDATQPLQPGETDEQAPPPGISAMVYHTEKWDENRKRFNSYCRHNGCSRRLREENVFWSGEKFMLLAETEGKKPPAQIKAEIKGTDYTTLLSYNGTGWEGSIFDASMINRWGRDGPEELEFVFSAEIDGARCTDRQTVAVDDRWPYMIMHRKE